MFDHISEYRLRRVENTKRCGDIFDNGGVSNCGRLLQCAENIFLIETEPRKIIVNESMPIKGGEIRDTKTLNLSRNIVSLQVFVDVSRFSPCVISLSRNKNICCGLKKVVAKSRARVYFDNKFRFCCSFFIKLTTCRATNLLVPYKLRGEKLNYNSCTSLLPRKSQNLLFFGS